MTKFEAFTKVNELIKSLKEIHCSNCPRDFSDKAKQVRKDIELLEDELGSYIDDFMAKRYIKYNVVKRQTEYANSRVSGQLLGRWKR